MRAAFAVAVGVLLCGCAHSVPSEHRAKGVSVARPRPPIVKDASDEQLRNALIGSSIERYLATKGTCPCPYSSFNRLGKEQLCGKVSAYCADRGEYPLCFAEDVPREMLDHYRHWRAGLTPMLHIPRKKEMCG